MARRPTDRYFGLGDKSGALDKHGRRLRTLALDALGYDAQTSDPLYKHWPYVIVRDRSGVAYGLFYDTLSSATFDLGCEHDNYHGLYRYCEIEAGDLDYYIFVGPKIRDVVAKFAELTGRMAFGPRWSLGYANTAMALTDAEDAQPRLSDFIDRVVEHAIPISAFHFGSGYRRLGPRRYVFTWHDGAASNGFGQAIPIDRSRPLQPLLMTRATYEAQAARFADERVYTVTRAGPPGIQRYAQTWSGDNTTSWHTLRWNIRMGLTMSLSGIFNTGHDVGGFHGPVPDPELLVRWVQSGVFSPRFIMNSWKAGGEVNTPWLHPSVTPIIRDWIRLRYRLLPYLYSLFRRAAQFGEPMLRPLFYEFEDESHAFADSDDFMLGPNLLVASVVEPGQRERLVHLPAGPGGWLDLWTGKHVAAGQAVVPPA